MKMKNRWRSEEDNIVQRQPRYISPKPNLRKKKIKKNSTSYMRLDSRRSSLDSQESKDTCL